MASRKLVVQLVLLAGLLIPLVFARSGDVTASAAPAWSNPLNVSQSKDYDTAPSIAAASHGSLTITWERRVLSNPTSNTIMATNELSLGGPFGQGQLAHSEPQKSSGSVRARVDPLGRRHMV